jgi:hypothetical protein
MKTFSQSNGSQGKIPGKIKLPERSLSVLGRCGSSTQYKLQRRGNSKMELTPEHSRTTFKVELVNKKFKSMEDFMMKYFVVVDKISGLSEKSKAYHHMVNLTQL